MTLLEAMAMRLPVVSTAVGGVPDLIEDDVNGLLVPAADSEQLANAIIRLASDSDLRVRVGSAARATIEQRFDNSTMSKRLRALYNGRRSNTHTPKIGSCTSHPINPGE